MFLIKNLEEIMPVSKSISHEIKIQAASIIKQIILTLSNPMSIVREALSNACAEEVGAKEIKVTHFYDKDFGYSWEFEDDGCGMPYSETDLSVRLNKFLNVGFGTAGGYDSDQFGDKGLGSKLCYAARKLIIESYPNNDENYYRVEVHNPYGSISSSKPNIPEPDIFISPKREDKKGTKITVLGYMGGDKEYKCTFNKIQSYLFTSTIVGTTSESLRNHLPEIYLKTVVDGSRNEEKIKTGYPFLQEISEEKGKIIVIDPITIDRQTSAGENVSLTLKGGYFLIPISSKTTHNAYNAGLKLSFNSIPYFGLYVSQYKGSCDFMNNGKDSVFVVECDDLDLDMGREDIIWNAKEEAFSAGLKEAYEIIYNSNEYKEWIKLKIKEKKKEASFSLNERIDMLQSNSTKWIYQGNNLIHRVPESENDTLALLWKLESLKLLPLYKFNSLEHTSQSGIDILADYQWDEISAKKVFSPIEVEYELENFLKHDHEITQAPLIICWSIHNKDNLMKRKILESTDDSYKFKFMGSEVLVLSLIPKISVRDRDL